MALIISQRRCSFSWLAMCMIWHQNQNSQLSTSSNFITLITVSWCIGFFRSSFRGGLDRAMIVKTVTEEKANVLVTKVTRPYKQLQIFWHACHKLAISAFWASHLQKTKLQVQFFWQAFSFPHTSLSWGKKLCLKDPLKYFIYYLTVCISKCE